jgi:MFS family permease
VISSGQTILRTRAFRNLVVGRFVVTLGNAVAPIALAFAVLDLTGSVAHMGIVIGARSLTNVMVLLFGGALGDRLPRHLLMVVSCLLAAGVARGLSRQDANLPISVSSQGLAAACSATKPGF